MPVVNGYAFRSAALVNLALGHVAEGREQLATAIDAFSRGAGQVGLGQAALCWVDLSASYLDAGDGRAARHAAEHAVEIGAVDGRSMGAGAGRRAVGNGDRPPLIAPAANLPRKARRKRWESARPELRCTRARTSADSDGSDPRRRRCHAHELRHGPPSLKDRRWRWPRCPSPTNRRLHGKEETMSRRSFLRRAGLGLGAVAVLGSGVLAYRAYDQGVLATGEGPAYAPWSDWRDGSGLLPLIGAATLAPSPHNAQAWLFGAPRPAHRRVRRPRADHRRDRPVPA